MEPLGQRKWTEMSKAEAEGHAFIPLRNRETWVKDDRSTGLFKESKGTGGAFRPVRLSPQRRRLWPRFAVRTHTVDLTGEPLVHRGVRFHGLSIRLLGNRTLFIEFL